MAELAELHHFVPGDNIKNYCNALGRFATGITVITAIGPDGPSAIIANSFASVSLDPPLILWSPDKKSRRHDIFVQAQHFVVHVLSAQQRHICDGCYCPLPHFFAAWICQWVNWRRVLHRPDGRARRQSFCLGPEPSASAANRHSALPIGEGSYVGREIHGGMPNDRSAEMASLVLRRMSSLAFGLMARLTVRLAWLWRPVFGQPRSSSARVLSCA